MNDVTRLVDELTTLLYEVLKRWEVQGRVCEIVMCGACRKKADKPASVVHEEGCPVYRLQRAEAANTAVIRANADEIADLEDERDALRADMGCRNELLSEIKRERQAYADLTTASTARIDALEATVAALQRERDSLIEESLRLIDDNAMWRRGYENWKQGCETLRDQTRRTGQRHAEPQGGE